MEKVIELANVNIYRQDKLIIADINLTVNRGEWVYITGTPRCGKSSFLQTLSGELPLREGSATIAHFQIKNMSWKQVPYLRRNVGIVQQDVQLPNSMTILDILHILMAATGWSDSKLMRENAADVLEQVQLPDKLYERYYELSSSEQQKVHIAMALLNRPRILLADDCTWNLMENDTKIIMDLLFHLQSKDNIAILFATNDILLTYQYPATTYEIKDGKFQRIQYDPWDFS